MTLNELIKRCEEVVKDNEQRIELFKKVKAAEDKIINCEKLISEHKQLIEWLRELKAYRGLIANADKLIESEYGVVIIEGYRDVLAQMKEIYEEVNADENDA